MQSFLPYPDFARSARVLDDRRLGKQRVEALQIYRALTREKYGWRNHPAVLMWRSYDEALIAYGIAMCDGGGGAGATTRTATPSSKSGAPNRGRNASYAQPARFHPGSAGATCTCRTARLAPQGFRLVRSALR